MKMKLAGLLIFSQASAQTPIDKSNYQQHLCDSGLFKPTSTATHTSSEGEQGMIHQHYQEYCNTRGQYDLAVEVSNRYRKGTGVSRACAGNQKDFVTSESCIQKTGIALAKACETLKQDKLGHPASWDDVMPTLVSCNNARRR